MSDERAYPSGQLVVGVDGSDRSVIVLRWAAYEALRQDAVLIAVHAYGTRLRRAPYAPAHVALGPGSAAARAIRRLEDCVYAAFDGHPPVPVHTVCDNRQPVPALLDYAQGAVMLVLGNSGTTPGPTARDCRRGARCPVVLLPAAAAPRGVGVEAGTRR